MHPVHRHPEKAEIAKPGIQAGFRVKGEKPLVKAFVASFLDSAQNADAGTGLRIFQA